MLKFFIDIEGTVIDDLKSRNFLTFNCSQIAKLIADRTKDSQETRVGVEVQGIRGEGRRHIRPRYEPRTPQLPPEVR